MRVCLLTDEVIEDYDPAVLLKDFDWDYATVKLPIVEFINNFARTSRYDVYLNTYEGYDDKESSGLRFVQELEKLNLPFTGAESKFYRSTREEMQRVAESIGLNFARGFRAESVDALSTAESLRFPLIVKHPNSSASVGLTKNSRVTNFEDLRAQFRVMASDYGSARVEEFIEGREMSCLVVENADNPGLPFVYQPAEVLFPHGESFLHEDAKWYSSDVYVIRLQDEGLAARIQEVSRKFFLAMDGTGYARVDVRVRPNGEIVILEINPNCGILYYDPEDRSHTDLPISWDKDGHTGFLERIFRVAIKRRDMRAMKADNPKS